MTEVLGRTPVGTSKMRTLMAMLGVPRANPSAARRFRNAAVTAHVLDPGEPWEWQVQSRTGAEMAAIALVSEPVRVARHADQVEAAAGVILLPRSAMTLSAHRPTSVVCVWVPWDAIADADSVDSDRPPVLTDSPLAQGLRAFARAVLGRGPDATVYTDYLVEKLLAEMAFGVLLEAARSAVDAPRETMAREPAIIERARTVMLLRRDDPTFGVDELARELHVSTRQLQRAFASAGGAPAEELRQLRVDHARQLLADPTFDALTTSQIALHAGFRSPAALRRALTALGWPSPGRRG